MNEAVRWYAPPLEEPPQAASSDEPPSAMAPTPPIRSRLRRSTEKFRADEVISTPGGSRNHWSATDAEQDESYDRRVARLLPIGCYLTMFGLRRH